MKPWLFIFGGLIMAFGLPDLPEIPSWVVAQPVADRVVLVYEKNDHVVASGVKAGLNALNRAGVQATMFEVDNTDGDGDVPEQYKLPLEAAKKAGLPALVVMSGGKVLRVVVGPKTQDQVEEATR